jgi:bifunctional non-homologous end joining protein LigD
MIAYVRDGAISLVGQNARDWTNDLPFLAADFHRVTTPRAETFNAIFDGEVALPDERGVTNVRDMLGANKAHLVYYAFDLLWWDNRELRILPLEERKAALRKVLTRARGRIVYSDHVLGPEGPAFYRAAVAHGCEGILSKLKDSPYDSAKKSIWLKVKPSAIAKK